MELMDKDTSVRDKIMLRLTRGAGQIASSSGGEIRRFKKIATSQILGSKQEEPAPEVSNSSQNVGFSILNELNMMGKAARSQMGGSKPSAQQITQMVQRDDEFSEKSADEVREKIFRIYREYEEKRKKERMAKAEQEKVEAEKAKQEALELQKKKHIVPINTQVAKTRAEIGKNYGPE